MNSSNATKKLSDARPEPLPNRTLVKVQLNSGVYDGEIVLHFFDKGGLWYKVQLKERFTNPIHVRSNLVRRYETSISRS